MHLSQKEIERIKLIDRLLNLDHPTVNDLIEQCVTTANLIDSSAEEKDVVYGPLERMHVHLIELNHRIDMLRDEVRRLRPELNPYIPVDSDPWGYNTSISFLASQPVVPEQLARNYIMNYDKKVNSTK